MFTSSQVHSGKTDPLQNRKKKHMMQIFLLRMKAKKSCELVNKFKKPHDNALFQAFGLCEHPANRM